MRHFSLLLFLITFSWSVKVEIVADRFDTNSNTHISIFTGNVLITKERDKLSSELLTVYTDERNHPTKYIATNNVKFNITSEDNSSVYSGSAQKLIFFPATNIYEFYTDVVIKQKGTKRTIKGDKVIIDSHTGSANVIGKKKEPIRITFELGETVSLDENNSQEKVEP